MAYRKRTPYRGLQRSQALAIALIAVIVGIPLGVALGGLIWQLLANSLGVASIPAVVIASISFVGLGALASALLMTV